VELAGGMLGTYARRSPIVGPLEEIFDGDAATQFPSVEHMLINGPNPMWEALKRNGAHVISGISTVPGRRFCDTRHFEGGRFSMPFMPRITAGDTLTRLVLNFEGTFFETVAAGNRRRRILDEEYEDHLPYQEFMVDGNGFMAGDPLVHPVEGGWDEWNPADVPNTLMMLQGALIERRCIMWERAQAVDLVSYDSEPSEW